MLKHQDGAALLPRPALFREAVGSSSATSYGATTSNGSAAPAAAAASQPSTSAYLYESLLYLAVVAVGAFLGCYIRIGFGYYHGTLIDAGFTVLYAQLLGSFIMGVVSEFQAVLMAGPRLHRLLYVFIATGLCGSITTFSTWHMETSQLLIKQLDFSPGSIGGSYNGGYLLEWLALLWLGFGLPLAALRGGQHVAQAWQAWQGGKNGGSGAPWLSPAACEAAIIAVFVLCTSTVIAVPLAYEWPAFTWAALFGATGAYLRYLLGPWNKGLARDGFCCRRQRGFAAYFCCCCGCWRGARCGACCERRAPATEEDDTAALLAPAKAGPPEGAAAASAAVSAPLFLCCTDGTFPVGTFVANLTGSLIQAIAISFAKFVVSYHDTQSQALLFGVCVGFCGCLTTLSSFVLELHRLPRGPAYLYGLISYAACIIGYMVYFTIPAGILATTGASSPLAYGPTINLCVAYPDICTKALDRFACPAAQRSIGGCSNGQGVALYSNDLAEFNTTCACGALDVSQRVGHLLVDAQSKQRVVGSLVPVWAGLSDSGWVVRGDDAGESIDFCLSYANLCANFLNRIECPSALRTVNACGRKGLRFFAGECGCGGMTLASARVADLVADQVLTRRYDVLPFVGYPARQSTPLDLCAAYESVCTDLMDHLLCPPSLRSMVACRAPRDPTSFVGTCTCFPGERAFTLGDQRALRTASDAAMKPVYIWGSMVPLGEPGLGGAATVDTARGPAGGSSAVRRRDARPGAQEGGSSNSSVGREGVPGASGLSSGPHVRLSGRSLPSVSAGLPSVSAGLPSVSAGLPSVSAGLFLGLTFDACASFEAVCSYFLQRIGCPGPSTVSVGCNASDPAVGPPPPGASASPAAWLGRCQCGELDMQAIPRNWVVDAALAGDVYDINYIAAPISAFDLVVSSSTFRPLLAPSAPLPGDD